MKWSPATSVSKDGVHSRQKPTSATTQILNDCSNTRGANPPIKTRNKNRLNHSWIQAINLVTHPKWGTSRTKQFVRGRVLQSTSCKAQQVLSLQPCLKPKPRAKRTRVDI